MTKRNEKKKISQVLWSNAQMNEFKLSKKDFKASHTGHGIFVKTLGEDLLYDLRLACDRPFWGHTHPLITQHHFNNLEHSLDQHYYSVPKTEYTRIIETFQKVHFSEILHPDFKVTYHNIVIDFDESLIHYDIEKIKDITSELINKESETFFWLVEKDITLLSEHSLFNFFELMQSDRVHLCLDFHFIASVFIYSHHLFSEDSNIQLFLSLRKMFDEVISTRISGKNTIDYHIIDTFLSANPSLGINRLGRYLTLNKTLNKSKVNSNGILYTESTPPNQTTFAFPLSGTKNELLDVLERIKRSI